MTKKILASIGGLMIILLSYFGQSFAYITQGGGYIDTQEKGYVGIDNDYYNNKYYYYSNDYDYGYDGYYDSYYDGYGGYNGYYNGDEIIYDYDSNYYEVSKYILYDKGDCYYNDRGERYCRATMKKSNSSMYRNYDCHYDFSRRDTVCLYPFTKSRQYIDGEEYNRYYRDTMGRRYYYDKYGDKKYVNNYSYGYSDGFYYHDSNGKRYYYDRAGKKIYVSDNYYKSGNKFYYDSNNRKYYFNQYGDKIYISDNYYYKDTFTPTYYYDEENRRYYYCRDGKKVYDTDYQYWTESR